jgi:hypothetical protein
MRRAEGARADRLEDVLRAGESSDDLVLLLRGGEDTSAKLLRQAALFETRYIYRGQRARGMSLFAASSAVDELAVARIEAPDLSEVPAGAGVELAEIAVLLPTFQAPHWTVDLRNSSCASPSAHLRSASRAVLHCVDHRSAALPSISSNVTRDARGRRAGTSL